MVPQRVRDVLKALHVSKLTLFGKDDDGNQGLGSFVRSSLFETASSQRPCVESSGGGS